MVLAKTGFTKECKDGVRSFRGWPMFGQVKNLCHMLKYCISKCLRISYLKKLSNICKLWLLYFLNNLNRNFKNVKYTFNCMPVLLNV